MATNIGTLMATIGVDTRPLKKAEEQTRRSTNKMASDWKSLAKSVAAAAVAFTGVTVAVRGMSRVFQDGFKSVENMRLSAASLASTITSFAKGAEFDLAGTYKQAYDYSTQLVLKMEEWNAKTVATGANLSAMVETLAQSGIVLDLNNKKQEQGFLAIANALALITQGQNQDIQFRQEIRGLAQGEVRATNLLARLLEQRVGGELKKHVTLWKQQGTLIESAGALLEGFQEGAKDLQNTWLAVGTTLETMYHRVLRGMFTPVYEDIIMMGREVTLNIMDQDSALNTVGETLKYVVYKGWQDIKNITESVVDIVAGFKEPLLFVGRITGMILDGWGQIFAILPAITNRIKLITQAVFDSVKMAYRFGETLLQLTMLNFEAASQSWEKSKASWILSGQKAAEAFSGGFGDELEQRLLKYNKDLSMVMVKPVLAPEMKAPLSVEGKKRDDAWMKDMQAQEAFAIKMSEIEQARLDEKYRLSKEISQKIQDDMLSETDLKLKQLDAQFLAYDEFVKDKSALDDWYVKKYEEIMDAANQERLEIQNEFDQEYAETGKSRFDLERMEVERMKEIYEQAGIDKVKIAQSTSYKMKAISKAETEYKISQIHSTVSTMTQGFQQISEMGGKHSKEAFVAYKAFKIVETLIATRSAAMKAYEAGMSVGTVAAPVLAATFAAAAVGFGMAQIATISGMQPPSYDKGGISRARGIYQTGNISEAHIPLGSGGAIPVRFDSKSEESKEQTPINIINVSDPSQLDLYLASSRGQDAILNVLSTRSQTIRKLLR